MKIFAKSKKKKAERMRRAKKAKRIRRTNKVKRIRRAKVSSANTVKSSSSTRSGQ